MQHEWLRSDLTGKALGEIGRQVLLIASALRTKCRPVSHQMILINLIEEIDTVAGRLWSLPDADEYESVMPDSLELLQEHLYHLRDDQILFRPDVDRVQEAGKLEQFGESLYDNRFDSENPPSDLGNIADELHTLHNLVRVLGIATPLVTLHAKWIAGGISLLTDCDHPHLSERTFVRIRGHLLAVMTALEDIASYERKDCLDLLAETTEFLNRLNPSEQHTDATPPLRTPGLQNGQNGKTGDNSVASEDRGWDDTGGAEVLRTLQRRFEIGANRYPGLTHYWLTWREGTPRPTMPLLAIQHYDDNEAMCLRWRDIAEERTVSGWASMHWIFRRHPHEWDCSVAWDEFQRLARKAGDVLRRHGFGLARQMRERLLSRNDRVHRWLLTVACLENPGWKHPPEEVEAIFGGKEPLSRIIEVEDIWQSSALACAELIERSAPATPNGSAVTVGGRSERDVKKQKGHRATRDARANTDPDKARSDPPSPPSNLPRRAMSVREFMEECCEEVTPQRLNSLTLTLQKASRTKRLQLPKVQGQWRSGQTKRYSPKMLRMKWPQYRNMLPQLPALKELYTEESDTKRD